MAITDKIGEVVESSTSQFTAQCYELHEAPPLGSLVKAGAGSVGVYGVVSQVVTASVEPGRRAIARGKDELDETSVYRENPQLLKLLRTDFTALVVGHRQENKLYRYLSPQPARLHSFVYICRAQELQEFSRRLDCLSLLLAAQPAGLGDELVAAFLRQAAQAHQDHHNFLVAAGKELVTLLNGQTSRLNAILKRMKQ
jgi:hypothetical protein